jgi:hypothetical protein
VALAGRGAPAAASPVEIAAPELACFDTPGAPLGLELRLTELDPALAQLGVTAHSAAVRELVRTCVAVGPAATRAAVPPVDLACYRIEAAPLPEPAMLAVAYTSELLALVPDHTATLVQPVELCLPVVRDGAAPPAPDVRRLIQSIALECCAVDGPGRPICVPVAKNSERIPRDVLDVVRRVGVERLAFRSAGPAAAPGAPGTRVVLHHLNPLLATLPAVAVVLHQASGRMVPVSRRAPPAP